jgi:tetratricopeptide (TPR) repeat protein
LKHRKRPLPFIILLGLSLVFLTSQARRDPAYWYRQGQAAMEDENWSGAVEHFLECLRLSPAHAGAAAGMAECYYGLGEFGESLVWVRKARALARADLALANLEAAVQTALGFPDEARVILDAVLAKEPYNREALFTAAEIDISRGRAGDAARRYREAVGRYPDDRRLFISLALTLDSLGERTQARSYIDKALEQHPNDPIVNYYGAWLYAQAGRLREAGDLAERALVEKPDYRAALSLLAALRYSGADYEAALGLTERLVSLDAKDPLARYMRGLCLERAGRLREARAAFAEALTLDPQDEFARAALEERLLSDTALEDPERVSWAAWHFARAAAYRRGSYSEQALFEYKRGLRLCPFAPERRAYAELLRQKGYPARYLEEISFLRDQGLSDQALEDALGAYQSLLADSLARRWNADPMLIARPAWNVAVFCLDAPIGLFHTDAGAAAAAYLRDILVHERKARPLEDAPLRQKQFSAAFSEARKRQADFFMLVSAAENERDLSIKAELFLGATGAPLAEFYAYRTGADRLRAAVRGIADQLVKALPFGARLAARRQGQGLIDKGKADGVEKDAVLVILKNGSKVNFVKNDKTINLSYAKDDVCGVFKVTEVSEELSAGTLTREGFFDRIAEGDGVYAQKAEAAAEPTREAAQAAPELRSLLRSLRLYH